jgi:hypothetical protein
MGISDMRRTFPKTLAFLDRYEKLLRSCAVFRQFFDPQSDPYYSVYDVGNYTFSPWKVLWSQVANSLDAVVVPKLSSPGAKEQKPVIPDHSLCSLSFHDDLEAHYAAACLNSAAASWIVRSYIAMHPSPNIMEYLPVRKFSQSDHEHQGLAKLSKRCHEAAAKGEDQVISATEAEIDEATAKLWGITDDELKAIQDALKEMERPGRLAKRSTDDEKDEVGE